MENNQEMLANLEKNTRQQLLFTKILCVLCALMVICTLVLMFSITGAVTEMMELIEPLQELTVQVQDTVSEMDTVIGSLAAEAETVMEDLGVVAEALAAAELGSIVENVNSLAADSQSAVADAMKKLDTIDIETLNKAIKDLAAVVEPLAKVSKILG